MQAAMAQTLCDSVHVHCRNTQRQPQITAPARLHGKPFCTARQQRHSVAAHGIPVAGPGDPFDEKPNFVSEETAQISQNTMATMKAKIQAALETEQVEIADTYGDGRHVSIDVVSPLFDGQSAVKRQRLVYKAIWEELQDTVHAVDAMSTKTPAEAAS